MLHKIILIFTALVASTSISFSQTNTLSLQDAIVVTLSNNYDVIISQQTYGLAQTNVNKGSAGYYPTLSIDGSFSGSISNTHLEFATGGEIDRKGALARSANAGLQMDWTVFNGFAMYMKYKEFNLLSEAAKWQFRNTIEQTVSNLMSAYYNLARIDQQINVSLESIALSNEKLQLAKLKAETGTASKVEYYQSLGDLNTDSITYINLKRDANKAKWIIWQYSGSKNQNINFNIQDSIELLDSKMIDVATDSALTNNYLIKFSESNLAISSLKVKQAETYKYPSISINSRYNFTNQFSQASQARLLNQTGLNYGISTQYNIFQGGINNLNEKLANANLQLSKTNVDLQKNLISSLIFQSKEDYTTATIKLKMTTNNVLTVSKNLNIAEDRYRAGLGTMIEYRQAQLSYILAKQEVFNAQFDVKQAEINLLFLSGKLSTALVP
ncbi:MAG: TolC family protein [Bacteroidota bacterium]|nr:TolC family protein [Bacteroidota bacterium]